MIFSKADSQQPQKSSVLQFPLLGLQVDMGPHQVSQMATGMQAHILLLGQSKLFPTEPSLQPLQEIGLHQSI